VYNKNIIFLKNCFTRIKKYKLDSILDLVFIILGPYLQIIYADRLIYLTNINNYTNNLKSP